MYPKYSKKAFDNKVTGDETWDYYLEPKRKFANLIWATENARLPSIAKRIRTVKKVLYAFLAHLSRGLKVRYCDRSSSIVCSSVRKLFL